MSMIEVLQAFDEPLSLGGDGRSDSHGHSAKYGAYSLMDLEHNVILNVELVQVCFVSCTSGLAVANPIFQSNEVGSSSSLWRKTT